MDWLWRNRLVTLSIILGIGMMGTDVLIHADLDGMQALRPGIPISFLVFPVLFGLYAQSLLQRAKQAVKTDQGQIPNTILKNVAPTKEKPDLAAAVFESTSQGIIIIDRRHCIVSVNPAFIALTGYTQDEIKGKNPLYLKSDRHNEAFYENI